MPDERRLHATRRRLLRQAVDFHAAAWGKRPRRVDVWSYRIAVVDEVQRYRDTILRPALLKKLEKCGGAGPSLHLLVGIEERPLNFLHHDSIQQRALCPTQLWCFQ